MNNEEKSSAELTAELEALQQQVAKLEAKAIEHAQLEEALTQEHHLLRTLIDLSPDGLVIHRQAQIEFINPAGVKILGARTAEEVIGQSIFDFIPFEYHNLVKDRHQQIAEKSNVAPLSEQKIRRRDGSVIDVEVTSIPTFYRNQPAVQTVLRDITERKRLQLELARFRAMMDQAGEVILVLDPPTGRVVDFNETACRLLGYTREELGLLSAMDIGADEPYPQDKWLRRTERIKQAQAPLLVEGIYKRKDGTTFPVEVIASYRNFEGQDYILALARDLSQLARLEAQLRQAQKLEAVGQLAAGVAHNFNNMLTAIIGYAGLALDTLSDHDPVRRDLEGIQRTAQRAANLTQQLLAFTRSQIIQPRLLNLNELVTTMNTMLRQLISETIELELFLAPDLGRVKVDPGQFEQVIVNLVVNARDAMPEGGKLTLATANVTVDQPYTTQHAELVPGNYVRLSVTDTGSGMTSEIKEHIFEPFFTTKEVGKGTGLGLATCFGVIKQSQGHIIVDSEPDQGSTFEIYLPRADEPARASTAMGGANFALKGTETILLVEDEREVREMAAQVLRRHGYTVLEASGGAEAIQLVKAQPETSIHLLLTDVVMPRIKGGDLANYLKRRSPLTKVLFISGYINDFYAHQEALAPEVDLLLKPFLPIALVQKVRQILDQE